MKSILLIVVIAVLCSSCAHRGTVSAKPNVQPAITSNKAARKSIEETRTHIKKSVELNAAEGETLKAVEKDLDELLKP